MGVSADKTSQSFTTEMAQTDHLQGVCVNGVVFVCCQMWAVLWPVPSLFTLKNEAS